MFDKGFEEALIHQLTESIRQQSSTQDREDVIWIADEDPQANIFSKEFNEAATAELSKIIRQHSDILDKEGIKWSEDEINQVKTYFIQGRDTRRLASKLHRSEIEIWRLIEKLSKKGKLM